MARVGHVLVGMAAARFDRNGAGHAPRRWSPISTAVVWSGLSLLPDADVIGFSLGVRYADPWGHRGATHSFVFAGAVSIVVLACARALRLPPLRTALLALVVLSSHALLDTLTDGGLGCALLWPFSQRRFFAPWNPLPVAPIGRHFFSREGLRVAAVEVVLLLPLVIYTFWPRRAPTRS